MNCIIFLSAITLFLAPFVSEAQSDYSVLSGDGIRNIIIGKVDNHQVLYVSELDGAMQWMISGFD